MTGADQTDITGRCGECGYDAPGPYTTREGVTRCYVCVSCHRRFDAARRRQEVMPNV